MAATLTKPSVREAPSERLEFERTAAVGASVRAMEKLLAVVEASASSRTERAAERRFALPDLPPSERRLVLLVLVVLLPPIFAVMGVAQKKRKRAAVLVAAVSGKMILSKILEKTDHTEELVVYFPRS